MPDAHYARARLVNAGFPHTAGARFATFSGLLHSACDDADLGRSFMRVVVVAPDALLHNRSQDAVSVLVSALRSRRWPRLGHAGALTTPNVHVVTSVAQAATMPGAGPQREYNVGVLAIAESLLPLALNLGAVADAVLVINPTSFGTMVMANALRAVGGSIAGHYTAACLAAMPALDVAEKGMGGNATLVGIRSLHLRHPGLPAANYWVYAQDGEHWLPPGEVMRDPARDRHAPEHDAALLGAMVEMPRLAPSEEEHGGAGWIVVVERAQPALRPSTAGTTITISSDDEVSSGGGSIPHTPLNL